LPRRAANPARSPNSAIFSFPDYSPARCACATLTAEGLSFRFPGAKRAALDGVDLTLPPGRTLGIVGATGAGKSTLVKILSGMTRPDAGTMSVFGQAVQHGGPRSAQAIGIRTAFQEISLVLAELHAQNLLLPDAPTRFGVLLGQGQVLASSRSDGAFGSVSAEMLAHHATSSELFVSRPYQPVGGGEAVMDISRSVDDRDDSEIVVITMPISYLVSDHDAQRFGNAGVLAVIGQDGVVRAKRVGEVVTSGDKADFSQLLPGEDEDAGEATLRPTPWGSELHYIGVRPLYGFPLAVVVALSEGERLADARAAAHARTVRSAVVTLVVLGLAMALSVLTRKVQVLRDREQAERAETARRIEHMAYHDSLTALPNRAHFGRRLSEMLLACRDQGEPFALMLLDLDGFKKVNDVQGHQGGDMLLVQVARRLSQSVRQGDFVARLGGDEFVVVCENVQSADDAQYLARRLLEGLDTPMHLEDCSVRVGASIGIALSQGDDDATRLIRSADAAMYRAKAEGRNRVRLASPEP